VFADLVAGLAVDADAFRQQMASLRPARRCYVTLFSPRSGNSWVTSALVVTRQLGIPTEYLNPDEVRDNARKANTTDPAGLLAILRRTRQTPNGIFGLKARAIDIELFGETAFFAAFGAETRYFYLWRDDVVAQGISLYRAVASGRWHSYDRPAAPPQYDADAIGQWISHVAGIENDNLRLLARQGLRAISLRYEDIIEDRKGLVATFAKAMGVVLPPGFETVQADRLPRRVSDRWNAEAQSRFSATRPDFIAAIAAERLTGRAVEREKVFARDYRVDAR
jgi:LPS sulfotransferase NodH